MCNSFDEIHTPALSFEEQKIRAEKRGVVVLPQEIDYNAMHAVLTLLEYARSGAKEDDPISLMISGDGGDYDFAISIINGLKSDGNVHGVVIGRATSAHALVWASCQKRIISPLAFIGIHQATVNGYGGTQRDVQETLTRIDFINEQSAAIFAAACDTKTHTKSFWLKQMKKVGNEVVRFYPQELLKMGMAQRVGYY